jgi:hypothetical protein
VAGACEFCSNAFEVGDEVREAQRIADGYSVVTF